MPVAPPRPKGPPLNALRAFEAAARLGGFAAAAEELGVSPGAVSQHIRTLEDWTGTPLFDRRSQGVRLTEAGRKLRPTLTHAFDMLGMAVRDLRALRPQAVLHIAALPSIAQLWLQPRLPSLRAALPGVSLSVSAIETPPTLSRDLFDLTLYMRDPDTAPTGLRVAPDALVPVCAPELAARLQNPADLSGETLLHDESWIQDWPTWAESTGTTLPNAADGPRFSLYAMAVAEAKTGAGVLIGHEALLAPALADGSLVAPFPARVPARAALMAELAPGPFEAPLRDWIATQS